jgi:UDP-N-acetylglucosamine 4,6-dehydratase
LIADGADSLPITDPRMTRFWITLQQGVDFVLSSLVRMRSGEIFVPRIPSMRIADLAAVMAPGLPLRTIGIRPGEKLHEVMVTEDDARATVELSDRYIIEPSLQFWDDAATRPNNGRPVADGFSYMSNNNDEWIDDEVCRELLSEHTD